MCSRVILQTRHLIVWTALAHFLGGCSAISSSFWDQQRDKYLAKPNNKALVYNVTPDGKTTSYYVWSNETKASACLAALKNCINDQGSKARFCHIVAVNETFIARREDFNNKKAPAQILGAFQQGISAAARNDSVGTIKAQIAARQINIADPNPNILPPTCR